VTPFEELTAWNVRLKLDFPKRLVGELELSESSFRELLEALRRFGETKDLFSPPGLFPRLILAAMTFTARYDYEGAFWSAFCENLRLESVDRTAWGTAYRTALQSFGLFIPPEHWMVNVFPVLFHSIVPEASLDDFAIMCRALCDAVDVRLLDDHELGTAIDFADLPRTLRRFVAGTESRAVALELVRHIAEDFRLGLEPTSDSLRGRILSVARSASEARTREFGLQVQPLPWRYDFNTGRCGVWLASSRQFEQQPYLLKLGEYQTEVRAQRVGSHWVLLPQLLSLPFTTEGADGTLESYSDILIRVRVGRSPQRVPLIFRSIGDAGTYESAETGPPGDYVVADTGIAEAADADGSAVECVEELPTLQVPGVTSTRLFSLEEGSRISVQGRPIFVIQAATRPSVELRARSFWHLTDSRSSVRVVSAAPSLDVRSPQSGSEFVTFVGNNQKPASRVLFDHWVCVRPQVEPADLYRASVWVDGRPSGASGCDFIVLPFITTLSTVVGAQILHLSGAGRLIVGGRILALDPDQEVALPLTELLLNDEITYEIEGKTFGLRYVGARPIVWGFERGALDTVMRSMRVDEVESHPFLIVTGNYGSTFSLSIDGKSFATATIDSTGFASLPLTDAVPLALGRGSIRLSLSSPECKFDVLEMVGVPQVRFQNVAYRDGHIVGQFALDGAVESLTLHASPFHAPWLPDESIECEGFGRTWNVEARLMDQRYSLFLTAVVDGVVVTILSMGIPWTKECGAAADRRSQIDVHLYELLNGNDQYSSVALVAQERIEILSRCFLMLDANASRKELPHIEALFRQLASYLRVSDIEVIERMLVPLQNHVADFAANCGLPVAAFRSTGRSHTAPMSMDSEAVITEQFIAFDGAGRTAQNEAALAPTIEIMESFPDPRVCY
jgi:hypothetical protein